METEIEAKFLDVDAKLIKSRLQLLGARLEHPERLMRRINFDFSDLRLKKMGGWVRLRDEGDKVTLSYKQFNNPTLHGTKEIAVEVDDFYHAKEILLAIGMIIKSSQESKREKWWLDDCEITIDTWPWIPTFVEIEAGSEELVRQTADKLGFDWAKAKHGPVYGAYKEYFNVAADEINECPEMFFGLIPEWLEAKRR